MSFLEYEDIHTVFDYYDGIRTGIANFHGVPHYYERPFDEALNDWADYFLLKPIDQETFRLAMEDWAIWQQWYVAWQTGKTPSETHPALPEDRARHDQIQSVVVQHFVVNADVDMKAKGELLRDYEGIEPKHATNPLARLRIKWRLVS